MGHSDPRLRTHAYVSRDGRLYEVMAVSANTATLENCKTEQLLSVYHESVTKYYQLVKAAPDAGS